MRWWMWWETVSRVKHKFPVRQSVIVWSDLMANSQYAYVRGFELADSLLSDTFIIFRLDGRSFHRWATHWIFPMWRPRTRHIRFSEKHGFTKPNDLRALQLMDHAAKDLMVEHPDIVLAFGESDEYRWRIHLISFCPHLPSVFSEQLSPPQINDTLQSKTIQNRLHFHLSLLFILRLPLVRLFSRYTAPVSTLLWWQNSPLSNG